MPYASPTSPSLSNNENTSFAPLPIPPRRARKDGKAAIFSVTPDDQSSPDEPSVALPAPVKRHHDDDDYPPPLQLKKDPRAYTTFKDLGLGLRVNTSHSGSPIHGSNSPLRSSPIVRSPGPVPFPTFSPQPASPSVAPPLLQRNLSTGHITSPSHHTRSASSTIIRKSNGQPVKSSLKSSQSSPHLPLPSAATNPYAASRSLPATPSTHPKAVHFPEKGLESVVLFEARQRPTAVSLGSLDREKLRLSGGSVSGGETETETEGEEWTDSLRLRFVGPGGGAAANSRPAPTPRGFPFPSTTLATPPPAAPTPASTPTLASAPTHTHVLAPTSSPVPSPHTLRNLHTPHHNPHFHTYPGGAPPTTPRRTHPHTNVLIESITLPAGRPPALQGTVIVRNLAFTKQVYIRFTMDGWSTTSEVACTWKEGLRGIPSTLADPSSPPTTPNQPESPESWDRFTFTIKLGDVERSLPRLNIELVARYFLPDIEPSIAEYHGIPGANSYNRGQYYGENGGAKAEFWDNNGGGNYRVSFEVGKDVTTNATNATNATTNTNQRQWTIPLVPVNGPTQQQPSQPQPPQPQSQSQSPPLSIPPRPRFPTFPSIPLKLSNYARPGVGAPIVPTYTRSTSSLNVAASSANAPSASSGVAGANSNANGVNSLLSPPDSPNLERGRSMFRTGNGNSPKSSALNSPANSSSNLHALSSFSSSATITSSNVNSNGNANANSNEKEKEKEKENAVPQYEIRIVGGMPATVLKGSVGVTATEDSSFGSHARASTWDGGSDLNGSGNNTGGGGGSAPEDRVGGWIPPPIRISPSPSPSLSSSSKSSAAASYPTPVSASTSPPPPINDGSETPNNGEESTSDNVLTPPDSASPTPERRHSPLPSPPRSSSPATLASPTSTLSTAATSPSTSPPSSMTIGARFVGSTTLDSGDNSHNNTVNNDTDNGNNVNNVNDNVNGGSREVTPTQEAVKKDVQRGREWDEKTPPKAEKENPGYFATFATLNGPGPPSGAPSTDGMKLDEKKKKSEDSSSDDSTKGTKKTANAKTLSLPPAEFIERFCFFGALPSPSVVAPTASPRPTSSRPHSHSTPNPRSSPSSAAVSMPARSAPPTPSSNASVRSSVKAPHRAATTDRPSGLALSLGSKSVSSPPTMNVSSTTPSHHSRAQPYFPHSNPAPHSNSIPLSATPPAGFSFGSPSFGSPTFSSFHHHHPPPSTMSYQPSQPPPPYEHSASSFGGMGNGNANGNGNGYPFSADTYGVKSPTSTDVPMPFLA